MLDFSELDAYAAHLAAASDLDENEWVDEWGGRTATAMQAYAPVRTGELRGSIRHSRGQVTVGVDYWEYVDRGTAHMAPRPFVEPAVHDIEPEAVKDVERRAIEGLDR